MDIILSELSHGFPDAAHMVRDCFRLTVALILAAIIGSQRERTHHAAGLRTHVLVALGSALFTILPLEAGSTVGEVTRVIQGIAAGIGFIGGGVILKTNDQSQVKGLTTAAGIWLTATIGVAAGLGYLGTALIGVVLTWIVLVAFEPLDQRLRKEADELLKHEPSKTESTND